MRIEKKIRPEYFEKILSGEKKYELRLADWDCKIGDILVLKECDPITREYTGREIEKEIISVLKTKGAEDWGMFSKEDIDKYGFQIISFN